MILKMHTRESLQNKAELDTEEIILHWLFIPQYPESFGENQ